VFQVTLITDIQQTMTNHGYTHYKNKFDISKQALTTTMQYLYLRNI